LRIRNIVGYTLIELMLAVAIVGVLVAIAIPAYIDYTIKAKMSEVTNAFDALATGVLEYHATIGHFPQGYPFYNLDSKSFTHGGSFDTTGSGATSSLLTFTFNETIPKLDGCTLNMLIIYTEVTGYIKMWGGDLPAKYLPKS